MRRNNIVSKLILKEKASIAALSSLISSKITGKLLSQAFRSHGSMLVFDFGRLRKERGPRKRYYVRGEWGLLVEWSNWRITVSGSPRVTDRSEEALIDKTLPMLLKQPVHQVAFNADGRFMMKLQNETSFIATGKGGRRPSRLGLWSLFNDGYWGLEFSCSRRFVVSPDTRVA
jgi:hypothetical protein